MTKKQHKKLVKEQTHYLKTIQDIANQLSEHSLMRAQDILEEQWDKRNAQHN